MKAKSLFLLTLILMVMTVSYTHSTDDGIVTAGAYAWDYGTEFDGYAWVGWDDMQNGSYRCEVDVPGGGSLAMGSIYGSGGDSTSYGGNYSALIASAGTSGYDYGGTYRSDWDSAGAP